MRRTRSSPGSGRSGPGRRSRGPARSSGPRGAGSNRGSAGGWPTVRRPGRRRPRSPGPGPRRCPGSRPCSKPRFLRSASPVRSCDRPPGPADDTGRPRSSFSGPSRALRHRAERAHCVRHPCRDGPHAEPGPARAAGSCALASPARSSSRWRWGSRRPAGGSTPRSPRDVKAKAIDANLHGGSFPLELGGQGWTLLEQVLVHEQLGQVTGGLWGLIPGGYNALVHCDPDAAAALSRAEPSGRAEWQLRDHRGGRRVGRPGAHRHGRSRTGRPASTSSTARSGSSPGRRTPTS